MEKIEIPDPPPCDCQSCKQGQRQRLVAPYCPDQVPTVYDPPCSCPKCDEGYLSYHKQTEEDIKYTGKLPDAWVKALPRFFMYHINEERKKHRVITAGNNRDIIKKRWERMGPDARRSLLSVAAPDMAAAPVTEYASCDYYRKPRKPSAHFFKTCQRERFQLLVPLLGEHMVRNSYPPFEATDLCVTNQLPQSTYMQKHCFRGGYQDVWFASQLVIMSGARCGEVVKWRANLAHGCCPEVMGFPRALAMLEGILLLFAGIGAVASAILREPSNDPEAPLPLRDAGSSVIPRSASQAPPPYDFEEPPPVYASRPPGPSTTAALDPAEWLPEMPNDTRRRRQTRGGSRKKKGGKGKNKKRKRPRPRNQQPSGDLDEDLESEESDSDDESCTSEEDAIDLEYDDNPSEPEEGGTYSKSLHAELSTVNSMAGTGSSVAAGSEQASFGFVRDLQQSTDPPFGSVQASASLSFRPFLASQDASHAPITEAQSQHLQTEAFPSTNGLRANQTSSNFVASSILSRNKRSASIHHVASSPPRDRARRDSEGIGGSFRTTPVREKIKTRGAPNLSEELPFRDESGDESIGEEEVARSDRIIPVSKKSLEIMHLIFAAEGETGAHEVH